MSQLSPNLTLGHVLSNRLISQLTPIVLVMAVLVCNASPIFQSSSEDICRADSLKKYLDGSESSEDVELIYHYCREQFLDQNKIGASVKRTIDDWIGTDLSQAETNEIFLVYELALSAPKPAKLSSEFERECKLMEDRFEKYRETIEPLRDHIDVSLNSLLASGPDEVEDQERDLFNYVQYSQFCRSLLVVDDDGGQ